MSSLTHDAVLVARSLVARAATSQAGVFAGADPSIYDATDPIKLWVIQVAVIIAMTQLLAFIFRLIRQPRVIAEVIGGVFLGPTVMGRIPHFSAHVFPNDPGPMAMLTLTSTIGLVLFLFLVGLEVDMSLIKRNVRASASISIAGLVIPLGLGAALGVALYKEFVNPTVNYGYFILFTAVAVGITAFPVLCRILIECNLLDTTVGVVVLSAGVGNDVVGWILLALSVALVNASTGLTALWVLLTAVGFVLFTLFPVRWGFVWLARRTGSLEKGSPTPFMMTITLLIIFGAAFFTDIIGIHPIFGGFLAGLIIPHENGFAIAYVEKIEDLVSILFLPLYFTLSGLRTNLGLLNDGRTWGYTFLICAVAFFAKFIACFSAAKLAKFNFRESGAIGALMSCKGLVELIVLNVGLQAGILDTRTFSMFVVHAIILTFITTPLTLLFYPERVRTHRTIIAKDKHGQLEGARRSSASDDEVKTKFAFIFDKLEQLPAAMTLSQLIQSPASSPTTTPRLSSSSVEKLPLDSDGVPSLNAALPSPGMPHHAVSIDALRLVELSDRTSAVFKSHEAETLLQTDPIVSVFRTFGFLNQLSVSATLSVVTHDDFATAVASHARESESQLVVLPWSRGTTLTPLDDVAAGVRNPFDGVFHKSTTHDQTSSVVYSDYIRKVFMTCPTDVALFVDRGLNVTYSGGKAGQHLFLPFFGGPDDRLALNFLVQLCANGGVTATVVKIGKTDSDLKSVRTNEKEEAVVPSRVAHLTLAAADTVYAQQNTESRLASDTADNLIWNKYTTSSTSHSPRIKNALNRIKFTVKSSSQPLHTLIDLINQDITAINSKNMIVMVGRSRRMAVESHHVELQQLVTEKGSSIGSAVPKTLGDVGAALVAAETKANLLILQAAV